MKVIGWLAVTTTCYFVLPCFTQETINHLPSSSPALTNMHHFKFKTRKIGGKNIAVLSFKLDPERGRRSILIPDAEGLLHPFPMAHHLRHHHRFLPPFEDEERFSLNGSLNWNVPYHSTVQETPLTEDEVKDMISNQMLQQMEDPLGDLQETLEEAKRKKKLESAALILKEKRRGKKKRRRNRKKGEKKKKKKNGKKSKKNKKRRKSRPQMRGQEACQYRALKRCAKKLGLLPKKLVVNLSDFEKCDQRKEFLECVEKRRDHKPCKPRSVARGNLPALRSWIKKLFWTSSSCLLNESMKGR